MKFLKRHSGLIAGLGLFGSALLLSQPSLAAGTTAGTNIQNLATVNYNVNGLPQTEIESAPGAGNNTPGANQGTSTDFLVDNRVDFTLIEAGVAGPTSVSPNQLDNVVEFTLTNTGNETQDYLLTPTNIVGGTVNGVNDTFDMHLLRAYSESNGTAGWQATDRQDFVDELAPDTAVTVYIVANADVAALINGDGANVNMLATTADGGDPTNPGGVTASTAGSDTVNAVDVVLAVGGVLDEGTANADDGYQVATAALLITKASTLVSDPFNGAGGDQKHIPGAIVRYTITVDNTTGVQNATNVIITDDLVNVSPNSDVTIDDGTNPVATCTTTDADADGCEFVGGTLTIGELGVRDITIVQGTIGTFTFEVVID
jgi:hypothetical protein